MPTENGCRVTGAPARVQGRPRPAIGLAIGRAIGLALLAGGLAGCTASGEFAPVALYHHIEGGEIARERAAPPNDNAPYPSLASVPTRPAAIDAATQGRIANALVADRANAEYTNSLSPLPAPAPTQRPYTPPAQAGALAATDDSAMSASLPAASAPPAAIPPPPRRAPVASVSASPLAAPPMPAIPAGPPPIPDIGGVSATVPSPPPPTPPVVAPPPKLIPGAPVSVAFAAGSAALPPEALAALRSLAARIGPGSIAVTGYGDATSSDPATQAAALPLAWSRAKTIAQALRNAKIPETALRITAEATGHGGVARIVK
jgi:outer membrane protein OmpA-like peptidoglycan-associated protein